MGDSTPRKGGKNLTTSPVRKMHYQNYKSSHVREKHKVKRVLKSSGIEAAQEYAKTRGVVGYLASLLK